jgi:nonsense-mediated mRNA decay protein 3
VLCVDGNHNVVDVMVMNVIGNVLKVGDHVLGYDLNHCNLSDTIMKPLRGRSLPDIVLVRKTYPNRKNRDGKRQWKLKQLPNKQDSGEKKKSEAAADDADMERFKQVNQPILCRCRCRIVHHCSSITLYYIVHYRN